jgi:hypothetical protein
MEAPMDLWPEYTLDEQAQNIPEPVLPLAGKRNAPSIFGGRGKRKKIDKVAGSVDSFFIKANGGGGDNNEKTTTSFESDLTAVSDGQGGKNTLIDLKKKSGKGLKGGRPSLDILDLLTICCYKASNPQHILWRCSGEGCTHTFSLRSTDRVFKHARICNMLPSELQDQAREKSAQRALSTKMESLSEGLKGGGKGTNVMKGGREEQPRKPNEEIPQGSQYFYDCAKKVGRAQRHEQITLAIIQLFCICGLPLSLASSAPWKNVLASADPSYKPPDRTALSDKWIPAEADRIHIATIEQLKTQNDLTLSLDGGTSHSGESFWTLHVSTPAGKVYLLQVREATAESHTGEWLRNFVMMVSRIPFVMPRGCLIPIVL